MPLGLVVGARGRAYCQEEKTRDTSQKSVEQRNTVGLQKDEMKWPNITGLFYTSVGTAQRL